MAGSSAPSTAPASTAARAAWIDLCKGITILLVMLLHASSWYGSKGGTVPAAMLAVSGFFAPVRMPTLIFLSGLLAAQGLRKGPAIFVRRRVAILLWPYLVWCVLWAFAAGTPERLAEPAWWLGGWYLWFMLFILIFSLVAALVPGRLHLVAAIYAYLGALACEDGTKYGERLLFFLAIFLIGGFLGRDRREMEARLSAPVVLAALAPAVLGIACWSAAAPRPLRYSPHDALPILVVVAGTLGASLMLSRKWPIAPLQAVGRNSLTIYLAHMPIIALTLAALRRIGVTGFVPSFAASLVLALSGSLALVAARRRWRAIDLLFQWPVPGPDARSAQVGGNVVEQ
ncbi:acyltransferase [Novosphingobium resinovorum]|uniref:acyltransferase n=1 Tax=Novosphingobium resinovorum TaxID=158500 RepID=UPI002ED3045D|nr:acyltransferase [Novosphingobium resinovorum]